MTEDKLVPARAAVDMWRTERPQMMEYIPKHFLFHCGKNAALTSRRLKITSQSRAFVSLELYFLKSRRHTEIILKNLLNCEAVCVIIQPRLKPHSPDRIIRLARPRIGAKGRSERQAEREKERGGGSGIIGWTLSFKLLF